MLTDLCSPNSYSRMDVLSSNVYFQVGKPLLLRKKVTTQDKIQENTTNVLLDFMQSSFQAAKEA